MAYTCLPRASNGHRNRPNSGAQRIKSPACLRAMLTSGFCAASPHFVRLARGMGIWRRTKGLRSSCSLLRSGKGPDRAVSARFDEATRHLARLIGRQMAREEFERPHQRQKTKERADIRNRDIAMTNDRSSRESRLYV
jgi:hypothetical protein